jgi:hypothetical protein
MTEKLRRKKDQEKKNKRTHGGCAYYDIMTDEQESDSSSYSLHNGPTSIWLPVGDDTSNTVSTLRRESETTSMNDTFAQSIGSNFSNSSPGTSEL